MNQRMKKKRKKRMNCSTYKKYKDHLIFLETEHKDTVKQLLSKIAESSYLLPESKKGPRRKLETQEKVNFDAVLDELRTYAKSAPDVPSEVFKTLTKTTGDNKEILQSEFVNSMLPGFEEEIGTSHVLDIRPDMASRIPYPEPLWIDASTARKVTILKRRNTDESKDQKEDC